jgi:hypothetical protein
MATRRARAAARIRVAALFDALDAAAAWRGNAGFASSLINDGGYTAQQIHDMNGDAILESQKLLSHCT